MKKTNVTYQKLDAILRSLDFEKSTGKNAFGFSHLRYENSVCDAIVLIQSGAAEDYLSAIDLHTVEKTIENRGVMSQKAFSKLLTQATNEQKQAA